MVQRITRQPAYNPRSQEASLIRIFLGVITVYAGQYVSQPLYCDDGNGLIYDESTTPWIALDVKEYTVRETSREPSGHTRCGDEILIWGDHWSMIVRALDAGPLHKYHIADYPALPIIGDLPAFLAPFPGLSARARMVNVSAAKRLLERMAGE